MKNIGEDRSTPKSRALECRLALSMAVLASNISGVREVEAVSP